MDAWRFASWWLLPALLLPVLLIFWRARRGGAAFGAFGLAQAVLRPSRGPLLYRGLVAGGLALLLLAAARPQYGRKVFLNEAQGRDLMLVLDLSLSMIADDIVRPDGERIHRLDAVVEAAKTFIEGRPADRIGVVFFSEEALLAVPLTFSHASLHEMLDFVREEQLDRWMKGLERGQDRGSGILGEGTNLGLGLGRALSTLRGDAEENDTATIDDADGRAMILITDGRDTDPSQLRNWVDPVEAARHAKDLDVNVYAIGVGDRDGRMTDLSTWFRYHQRRLVPVPRSMLPDMNRLQEIVSEGSGRLMRADDLAELDEVFAEIDQLEPSRHEVRTVDRYADRFRWPLWLGLCLLGLGLFFEPRLRGPL